MFVGSGAGRLVLAFPYPGATWRSTSVQISGRFMLLCEYRIRNSCCGRWREMGVMLVGWMGIDWGMQVQRAIIDSELVFSLFVSASSCQGLDNTTSLNCFDERRSITSRLTTDFVTGLCIIMEDVMGIQGIDYSVSTRYCLADYNPNQLGVLYNVDGFLGMGYLSAYESKELHVV